MQDIPLAAALRGPLYGFSADELAEIRAGSRGTDFYTALVKAAAPGLADSIGMDAAAALNKKCVAFLSDLDAFRVVMPDMPADRFIWHVYNKTGLLALAGAMQGGLRRRNNLILLAESAQRFEQNGYKGLFGFLTYIRGLQERGAELARDASGAASNTVSSDAVRIMSIHKSKGLEFPVVILADTSKQFNNRDAMQTLVMHPTLGVGVTRTDRRRRIEYTTLARMAIQSKLTSEMMAEELRVLYVAMTRAREKLIITATLKDAGKEIEKLSKVALCATNAECRMQNAELGDGETVDSFSRIAPQVLEDTKSMAGWILLPILANSEFGVRSSELTDLEHGAIPLCIRIVSAAQGLASHCSEGSGLPSRTTDSSLVNSEFLIPNSEFNPADFAYPYPIAPELPSKLTVTGLKGRHAVDAGENSQFTIHDSQLWDGACNGSELRTLDSASQIPNSEFRIPNSNQDSRSQRFAFARPKFVTEKTGLTAAERGTALHLALQHIDFQECANVGGIGNELLRLKEKGLLTEEQAATADVRKIALFFESEAGRRVLGAEKIWREFKFSLLYPAERFFPGGGDDEILLQGVVDCFFEEGDELVVVDFKTDHVTQETLEEKAMQYAPQLSAYSDALERITGKRVKERIIYFFSIDSIYSIKS